MNFPKLKVWVEVGGRTNGLYEDLIDLPADWDHMDGDEQRVYAQECWQDFRDNIANGGFALVHEDGAIEEL